MVYITPLFAVPVFQVQAIGPEWHSSTATAISATGAVVGNYQLSDGTYRAYLWQDGQASPLSLPGDAVQSWAAAIGGTGQAGGYTDSRQATQGLIWDNLGNPSTTAGAYVLGMNANGDAAGMGVASDGSGYAFVTRNGVMTNLGQPAGGGWSSANAVNAGGAVAGTAMNGSGNFQAFYAAPDNQILLLGGLGGANSYGMAVSGSGTVAGHAQTSSGSTIATIWLGTTAHSLGTLGGTNSYGYGINASGQVVGYSDLTGDGGTAAFLFDNGQLYNLNGLLGEGSGWQLLAAYGMNDNGQIVGRGIYQGTEQAFLLTPQIPQLPNDEGGTGIPEPASLLLVGAPLLAVAILRIRSRY